MTKWLLILPIYLRLYTSVIPLDPEICLAKVSWSTDLSPTTIYLVAAARAAWCTPVHGGCGVAGVYPGYGYWVGPGGVLYRVPARTLQNHGFEGPG